MAAEIDDVGQWLLDNADKQGSPEYVQYADRYRQLASGAPEIPSVGSARSGDPYDFNNTMDRFVTGIATGYPDLGIAVYNAGQRTFGDPNNQIEPLQTRMLRGGDALPLPADASPLRRYGEAALQALFGGGIGAGQRAFNVARAGGAGVAPAVARSTVAATAPFAGAVGGGALVENTLGRWGIIDPETANLIGSLAGGAAGARAPQVTARTVEGYYGRNANPDAPQIAADAASIGVPTTAGMLGNDLIKTREKSLDASIGGHGPINRQREAALEGVRGAVDDIARTRGANNQMPTEGSVGQNVIDAAEIARNNLRGRVSTLQEGIESTVGPRTRIPATGLVSELARLMPEGSDPGTTGPLRNRARDLIDEMIIRNGATGAPILDVNGNVQTYYGPTKDWRTNLRRQREGQPPVSGNLHEGAYTAATETMREGARQAGIPRAVFDAVQAYSAQMSGPGGPIPYFTDIAGGQGRSGRMVQPMRPDQAYNVMAGGEQSPAHFYGPFQQHAPVTSGPMFGNYLRLKAGDTIGSDSAAGPRRYSGWVESLPPEAQTAIAGARAPELAATGRVAGAIDYPTRGSGLNRALQGGIGQAILPSAGAVLGALGSGSVGLPTWLASGIAAMAPIAVQNARARIMQSETARGGMAGHRTPVMNAPTAAELQQILQAAEAQQRAASPWP